ncbi:hypothetical protein L7F22_008545 [Adiantum nelumboides]|nr:hypothetical protein [Adiantum nelumboides]
MNECWVFRHQQEGAKNASKGDLLSDTSTTCMMIPQLLELIGRLLIVGCNIHIIRGSLVLDLEALEGNVSLIKSSSGALITSNNNWEGFEDERDDNAVVFVQADALKVVADLELDIGEEMPVLASRGNDVEGSHVLGAAGWRGGARVREVDKDNERDEGVSGELQPLHDEHLLRLARHGLVGTGAPHDGGEAPGCEVDVDGPVGGRGGYGGDPAGEGGGEGTGMCDGLGRVVDPEVVGPHRLVGDAELGIVEGVAHLSLHWVFVLVVEEELGVEEVGVLVHHHRHVRAVDARAEPHDGRWQVARVALGIVEGGAIACKHVRHHVPPVDLVVPVPAVEEGEARVAQEAARDALVEVEFNSLCTSQFSDSVFWFEVYYWFKFRTSYWLVSVYWLVSRQDWFVSRLNSTDLVHWLASGLASCSGLSLDQIQQIWFTGLASCLVLELSFVIVSGTFYPSTLGSGPSAGTQGSATQDPHIATSDSSSDFDVMEGYPMQQHPESSSQDMHALGQQPGISMFSRLKETLSRATRSEHATNEINEGGGEVDLPFTSQIDPVLSESAHVSTPTTTPIGLSKLTPSETLLLDGRRLVEVQEVERYILVAREKEIKSLRKAEQRRATLAKAPMTSANPLQSPELTTLKSQPIGSHIASGSKDTSNTSILDGVFLNEN